MLRYSLPIHGAEGFCDRKKVQRIIENIKIELKQQTKVSDVP
jgi:hypothetical protein